MDVITLAMLNGMKKSSGVGYTEKNTFSWDGNTEGKVSFSDVMFKVSDKTPDVNTFVRVKGLIGGTEAEFEADNCVISDIAYGLVIRVPVGDSTAPVAAVITKAGADIPETGLYLFAQDEENFVTYIEFAETIVPIAPKYLPEGIGTPIINLGTLQSSAAGTEITDEAAIALLEKASANRSWQIIILLEDSSDGALTSVLLMGWYVPEIGFMWVGQSLLTGQQYYIGKVDDVWKFVHQSSDEGV